MKQKIIRIITVSTAAAFALLGGSTVLALPPQASAHAQAAGSVSSGGANNANVAASGTSNAGASHASAHTTAAASNGSSQGSSHAASGQANGQAHLAAAQLKACQNRQNAINNIMSRIDTRAQNQITLFSTIATRVENFYTSKGKTLPTYNQLVSAVAAAQSQAESEFGTLKTTSTLSCTSSNPKGMVTAFQGYLKTEISDLQSYRTSVKNLIVGVASVNGVTVSSSAQTSSSQGGQ